MKLVTVKSDKHETEARIWVPETILSTRTALRYLETEGKREKETTGRYGKMWKRYLEAKRKLCRDKACDCGVNDEPC